MQKLFKKWALVLTAMIAVLCMATFALACTDGGNGGDGEDETEYATDTFTVLVVDEDGNPIDGTTFLSYEEEGETVYEQLKIQYCAPDGACSANLPAVGTDGKATLDVQSVRDIAAIVENNEIVELHVLPIVEANPEYYEAYEVISDYLELNTTRIPLEIVITIKTK